MKVSMDYGANTYGNTANAALYTVKMMRRSGESAITIAFEFAKPAGGRGVGSARGEVRRVELELPSQTGSALAHALKLALNQSIATELRFQIEESDLKN